MIASFKTRWECHISVDRSYWVYSLVERCTYTVISEPRMRALDVKVLAFKMYPWQREILSRPSLRTESRPNRPRNPIRLSELQCAWTKCRRLSPATPRLASMECDICFSILIPSLLFPRFKIRGMAETWSAVFFLISNWLNCTQCRAVHSYVVQRHCQYTVHFWKQLVVTSWLT